MPEVRCLPPSQEVVDDMTRPNDQHGHDCSHCYYLGEDDDGHDHFICHKHPKYPVLVRAGAVTGFQHVTSMQVYLKSRGLNENWAQSIMTVHRPGMVKLENLMGCRFGQVNLDCVTGAD